MNTRELSSYQQLKAYGHDLEHIDKSWLLPLGVESEGDFAAIQSSHRGLRSLTITFLEHYHLASQPSGEMARSYHWVWRGRTFLHVLALRLGLLVNADFVRTSVTRQTVGKLHDALGVTTCREAVEASIETDSAPVVELTRSAFDAAVHRGDIAIFLTTLGQRLLELSLTDADDYARQRLQFSFPADKDDATPLKLKGDRTQLANTVERIAGEL